MPFTKRTYRPRRRAMTKRTFKRRSYFGKKPTRRARMQSAMFRRGNVHRFTRYTDVSYLSLTNAYTWADQAVGGGAPAATVTGHSGDKGFVFNLDDVVKRDEYVDLFDQYRILSCVVEVTPLLSQMSGVVPTPNVTMLRWFYDADDNSTLGMSDTPPLASGNADVFWGQRAPNVRQVALSTNRTIYIPVIPTLSGVTDLDPTFATQVAVLTGKKRQWIDCGAPNVPHYGLKMQILQRSNTVSDATPIVSFRIKYNLEFKGTR